MSSNNMINPANYYNPFAKYNYVSKSRGVYIPKETEPLLKADDKSVVKSSNIFSDNYDAETDLLQSMNSQDGNSDMNGKLLGFINKFFGSAEN